MRVLVAGGGVGGLEALLALKALAGDLVATELLCPAGEFVYRPLLVAEPFGAELTTRLDLGPIVEEAGAGWIRDGLAAVDPVARTASTAAGGELRYDALVVATGARPAEAVPGALTFAGKEERDRFGALLGELGHRGSTRLAIVVPAAATWSVAAYELALLTASERAARALRGVEIAIVTHERAPLELIGAQASALVAARLAESGVELHTGCRATRFADGAVQLDSGEAVPADHAVALPRLEVPPLPGLPQRRHGFVHTDVRMQVDGLEHVWAAGDVTSFPIKQGGLAAQQADVAAAAIAARAGAHVAAEPFQAVLRAALITGGSLEFMRSGGALAAEAAGESALWWPPTKLAGAHLGPVLARAAGEEAAGTLHDVEASSDPEAEAVASRRAIEAVLAAADADARHGAHEEALAWLELAEAANLALPPEYVAKRHEWRRRIDRDAVPGAAAKRIDPSFGSAAAAISDLQRRLGWLRELERRQGGEMSEHLRSLEAGLEHLRTATRRS